MGSSRKPRRAESASSELLSVFAGKLRQIIPRGSRLLVALSGGVDSVVLLDLLVRLRLRHRLVLRAMHVNHQLQPQAAEWTRFCRRLCRERGVPLRVVNVRVAKGNSTENAARKARYAALLSVRADYIVLAHNEDDQAETVLLHLLRGSGIHGLAGMREVSAAPVATNPSREPSQRALLFRPLLDVPRGAIERYAGTRRLQWIEDPTNVHDYFLRNFLRRDVLPRIETRWPAYRDALVRAARHAAEAGMLLEALADLDADAAAGRLSVRRLGTLSRTRAKNVLSHFLARHGIGIPGSERLEEALHQLLDARHDARVRVALGPVSLRRFRDEIALVESSPGAPASDFEAAWRGERALAVSELDGTLSMRRVRGYGISAAKLKTNAVTLRVRRGGERLQPDARRPRRTVKNLLQELRLPPWARERLPFLYCGEDLVWVPVLGVDARFQAGADEPGWDPQWTPGAAVPPRRQGGATMA